MKKITCLATLLMLLPFAVSAQDCAAVAPPYTIDFESVTTPALPACTTQSVGFGSQWSTAENPGNGFTTKVLKRPATFETSQSIFVTQGVQLTAGTYYKVQYTYGNDSTTTTESLITTLSTSADGSVTTGTIGTHAAITGGTPTTFRADPLIVTTSGVYYLAFNANSAPEQGNLYLDNIEITEWSCQLPVNVTVSSLTTTAATFSWTPPADNTSFQYFYWYSESSEIPAGGPPVPAGVTSVSVTDLEPGTTYYLFIKNQCGPTMSDWTEPLAFTTPTCAAATAPYTLNFDSAVIPALPECTSVGTFDTGNNWRTAASPGSGFDSNVLWYPDSDEPADSWFFTQGVELVAGTAYRFSYKYGNDSTTTTERLRTVMLTSPNADAVEDNYLTDHPEVTGGVPVEFSFGSPITISTTGVYYFGFNAYSRSEEGSLYVDNIVVEEWICGTPQNVTADDVTDTTATLNWEAQSEPTTIGYFYGYSTTNTPPEDIQMATGTGLTASLSNLAPFTTYYAYVRTLCGPVWSDWVITEFTTDALNGTTKTSFNNFKAYPNPVTNILTINNATAIDKIELYNLTGQLVLKKNIGTASADVNLENLSSGVYLLTAYAGELSKKVRIVKQ